MVENFKSRAIAFLLKMYGKNIHKQEVERMVSLIEMPKSKVAAIELREEISNARKDNE